MWIVFGIIALYVAYHLIVSMGENEKETEGHYTILNTSQPVTEVKPVVISTPARAPEQTNVEKTDNQNIVIEKKEIKMESPRTYISFYAKRIEKLNDSIVSHAKLNNYKIIDISISATYVPITKDVDHFAIVTFESLKD